MPKKVKGGWKTRGRKKYKTYMGAVRAMRRGKKR